MTHSIPLGTYDIKIVLILAVGFAFASLFGFIMQKTRLSPIIGYLAAGYLIGPYSPGFVADLEISEQLAEIGVVLMMFGVGMHFRWQELVHVRNIAVPGAIGQTLLSTCAGIFLCWYLGWSFAAGVVIGISVGVASTVVMVRILQENKLLGTPQGHIAVGWLIVEDLITVIALLLLPVLVSLNNGQEPSFSAIALSILWALAKCAALLILMFVVGLKVITSIVNSVAKTRSQELFTITVLALIFVIATGSAFLFGTSLALGAFIAGMIIGQTHVKHQASANALPLKDTFAVIFFLSIGMLFNPHAIMNYPALFIGILSIILLIKPIAAYLIVILLRKPVVIALTVAAALAQIGEFSFILAQQAMNLNLLPEAGFDLLVAGALISIALNPLLFQLSKRVSQSITKRAGIRSENLNETLPAKQRKAVIVGFGPIGQGVFHTLEKHAYSPIVVDTNLEMIELLIEKQKNAVYGDAATLQVLEAARMEEADLLVITSPDINSTLNIVKSAKQLNPKTHILVRANYTTDQRLIETPGIQIICNEEEAKIAFIQAVKNYLHQQRKQE